MYNFIKTITVIGANGTLGKEVSGIFASFGNAKVYMISRTIEKSKEAKREAALSVKALSIEENLIPKTFKSLKECIEESDLVFESVIEDYEIKKSIHKEINKFASDTCIIATGTSGLSIDELAKEYSLDKAKHFMGIHFFNPPYSLTLCEIIPSEHCKKYRMFIKEVKDYLVEILKRDVIEVKNEPAFLANRIGFKFMNEALQFAEKYKKEGGIDYIDSILGCYTGRNMPPIETVNFVGLDVHKAIVDNIYLKGTAYEKEAFQLPQYINELILQNKLGVKVNEGLYKKDKDILVYDIETKKYRPKRKYNFIFKEKAIQAFSKADYEEGIKTIKEDTTEEGKICMYFLLKYIVYSIIISEEVSEKVNDCDIAMATGFNWIPPHSLIEAFGGKEETIELCNKYLGRNKKYISALENVRTSKYDYRKFLKAKE